MKDLEIKNGRVTVIDSIEEKRCKKSEKEFSQCIDSLMAIGKIELAENLFDKYSPLWC